MGNCQASVAANINAAATAKVGQTKRGVWMIGLTVPADAYGGDWTTFRR